jgi:hypothetical protein
MKQYLSSAGDAMNKVTWEIIALLKSSEGLAWKIISL